MLHEKSCGAIVYRRYHGNVQLLLIKHINSDHWSFPKGHVEGAETEPETARREIKEETGLDVYLDETFRETVIYTPKRDTVKIVVYFLALARRGTPSPQADEISELRWVDINRVKGLLTYENDKSIVSKAMCAIRANKNVL